MEETDDDISWDENHKNNETADEKGDTDNYEERDGHKLENEKSSDHETNEEIDGKSHYNLSNFSKFLVK